MMDHVSNWLASRLLVGLALDFHPTAVFWAYVFWGLWWVRKSNLLSLPPPLPPKTDGGA